MKRVLFVRHGDIAADMTRYWGHADVPLSDVGMRQAELLAQRLAAEELDVVYCSDLRRAVETAAVIAGRHRMSAFPCPDLREIDFGRCEGLTFHEMAERYPETEAIWGADGQGIRFPGGESVVALTERLTPFAEKLRSEPYETALIVAHGGSLRVLVCCLAGLGLSAWREMRIERASLSIVAIEGRQGKVLLLNDMSHLGIREAMT